MRPMGLILAVGLLALAVGPAAAQEPTSQAPRPPSNVEAEDWPHDSGGIVRISWELSPDDAGPGGKVVAYRILRSTSKDGIFRRVSEVASQKILAKDKTNAVSEKGLYEGEELYYKVAAVGPDGSLGESAVVGPARAVEQIFKGSIWNFLLITLIICGAVIYYIETARRGKKLFIRKIAGLEAVDEAIGRATEMGRSILFVPGIQDMNDIQTIAGITIMGHVAKGVAEYGARLTVPTSRSLVMTAARETVKASYLAAGRPDAYSDDMVFYLTDEQFGYVTAVTGIMVREKPAACFYQGAFFAESLILAETGNTFGSIQIAGTAQPAQLPFFVAACDYTLIGEEFFAASAYLSGEPQQLGSLKGQDVGKLLGLSFAMVGSLTLTLAMLLGHGVMEFATAEEAAGAAARIVEIWDPAPEPTEPGVARPAQGGVLDGWTLDGISVGENTGPGGTLWVEVVPGDPLPGASRISLYADEAKSKKVAEGKGFPGRKIFFGPVGKSGLSGEVWLREGVGKEMTLHVQRVPHAIHGVAEAIRRMVTVEQ